MTTRDTMVLRTRAATGEYIDAYSVRKNRPRTPSLQLATVTQRPAALAGIFGTEEEAIINAIRIAHEWVDSREE